MRNYIVVLIVLLLMPSVTLAGKPVKVYLQAMIETEAATRAAEDTNLQNNINAEASTRQADDVALQAIIEDETQLRIEDDAVLQSNITDEEIARQDGDTALQGQIDGINTDLTPHASVMYLRVESPSDPPECPELWEEAGLTYVPAGSGFYYYERTCFYCTQ